MTRLARRNLSSLAGRCRAHAGNPRADWRGMVEIPGASHRGAISRVRSDFSVAALVNVLSVRNRYDLSSVDYIKSHPRGPLVGVGRAWKSPCPAPYPDRRGNHGVVVAAIARIRRSAQSSCAIEGLALHRAGSGTTGWARGESRGAAPNFNDTRYADIGRDGPTYANRANVRAHETAARARARAKRSDIEKKGIGGPPKTGSGGPSVSLSLSLSLYVCLLFSSYTSSQARAPLH